MRGDYGIEKMELDVTRGEASASAMVSGREPLPARLPVRPAWPRHGWGRDPWQHTYSSPTGTLPAHPTTNPRLLPLSVAAPSCLLLWRRHVRAVQVGLSLYTGH